MKYNDLFDFGVAFHRLSNNQIKIIDGLRRNGGVIEAKSWGELSRICGFPDNNTSQTKDLARELERVEVIQIFTEYSGVYYGLRKLQLVPGWEENLLENSGEIQLRNAPKKPRKTPEPEKPATKKRGRPRKNPDSVTEPESGT